MRTAIAKLSLLLLVMFSFSCEDERAAVTGDHTKLILGTWDSYEMGSTATGFIPGVENLMTVVYASGFTFYADNHFALRTYSEGIWSGGPKVGTYRFRDSKTLELTFSPGTPDESSIEVRIDKLTAEFFWFQHDYWVSESNPDPAESHLRKLK